MFDKHPADASTDIPWLYKERLQLIFIYRESLQGIVSDDPFASFGKEVAALRILEVVL